MKFILLLLIILFIVTSMLVSANYGNLTRNSFVVTLKSLVRQVNCKRVMIEPSIVTVIKRKNDSTVEDNTLSLDEKQKRKFT